MAKYDPKRPRPMVGDDQAAPVEALIEAVSAGPEIVEDRAGAAADPVETGQEMGESSNQPHISDVPVIPPPEEGTANRAVLAAIGTGFVIALVLAVLLRIKRSKG